MQDPLSAAIVLKHGSIALFGAVVHALMAHRSGESKTFTDFLVLVCVSSFSGVMFALLALHFWGGAEYLTLCAAGTGGYVGVEGMSILIQQAKKRFLKK